MIKVYFGPQVALPGEQIEYSFNGETLTVKIGDTEDVFDLSSLPDGELNMEEEIETTLPVNPIISAKRVDGILYLELLNWIGLDAPYESRFPEWCELPLPEEREKDTSKVKQTAIIPWRTKEQIDAERMATALAIQEGEERRARIKEGLTIATTESELRAVMVDMAIELGLLD